MEVARSNSAKITSQVEKLFKTLKSYALLRGYTEADMGNVEIMNNEQWWKSMTLQEFFNEIARHMRLAPMLARERYTQQFENSLSPSVKLRLQSPEGIDVASFLYQSLQAYDFLRLNQLKKCRLQVMLDINILLTVKGGWFRPVGQHCCRDRPLSKIYIDEARRFWTDCPSSPRAFGGEIWKIGWKCTVPGPQCYPSL